MLKLFGLPERDLVNKQRTWIATLFELNKSLLYYKSLLFDNCISLSSQIYHDQVPFPSNRPLHCGKMQDGFGLWLR